MILFALNTVQKPKKKNKLSAIDKNLLKIGLKKGTVQPSVKI